MFLANQNTEIIVCKLLVLLPTGLSKLTDANSSFSFSFSRSKKMSGSRENPRERLGNWLPRWRDNSSVHLNSDKVQFQPIRARVI